MRTVACHEQVVFYPSYAARTADGEGWSLVVQGRVPVGPWLSAAFSRVESILQDTRYRVWRARDPKRAQRRP